MSLPDEAGTVESAPTNVSQEAPVTNEVPEGVNTDATAVNETESAPVETAPVLGDKGLEELKTQRKKRQQAEQEAAYWRGVAEARAEKEKAQEVQQTQVVPQKEEPPELDNFETYAEYEVATRNFVLKQATQAAVAEMKRQQQVAQQQTASQSIQQKFNDAVEKAAEEDITIKDAVNEIGRAIRPNTMHVAQLIKEADNGVGIVKHFHNNPAEFQKILKLSPLAAAKEIGKIEAALQSKPKAAPPKTVSLAPAPITTVTTVGTVDDDMDNLPMDEYLKRLNASRYKLKK
jgi:hypothetical protein